MSTIVSTIARAICKAVPSLSLVLACGPTAPVAADTTLTGTWAGAHAKLDLTTSRGGVEYDCAHGSVAGAMHTDGDGRFAAVGYHVREHGGPVREGERVDSVPARYTGSVVGDRMTLRVIAGTDTLGPFALERDGVARLFKCL